ncbi:MAG: DMT family transporter, partial [bacterium]|nr:DMT family transporter [bacterium]
SPSGPPLAPVPGAAAASSPASATAGRRDSQPTAFLLMTVTVAMWAISPLFVKYFAYYYNPWTQNALRYGVAALALLIVAALRRGPAPALTRAQWAKLAVVAVINIVMQTDFAAIYYFIYPSVASLVARANIVFAIVFSFLVFRDERRVIRSPFFLSGSLLALAGIITVILGQDADLLARLEVSRRAFWIGVVLAFGYALLLAVYVLAIKHAVRDIAPLISFTHVSWMTAVGLFGVMGVFGGTSQLWLAPARPMLLIVVSALLCIVVAHTAYYRVLRELKAVVTMSLLQLVPLVTCVASAAIYHDRLSPMQIVGGGFVIAGAWLASLAQVRQARGGRNGGHGGR